MVGISVWLNAAALFIPAMIGVGGSYWLYQQRQQDRKQHLRAAFLAELEGTGFLDVWPDASVPSYDFLSVSVYESNTDSFGLLTDDEVTALVHYYSLAKSVQDSLRVHSQIITHTQGSMDHDTNRSDRESALRSGIDKLELARQRAILTIHQAQANSHLPTAGTAVSELPGGLPEDEVLLLDFGFADYHSEDSARLTEQGEAFFAGELLLTGLERERDVLDREKSLFRQGLDVLWNWVRGLVK